MSDSVQSMIRPGEPLDLYYYSGETSKKAAFPVTVNTKYQQQLNNLSGGSSTFLFPPNNGIQDVVCSFTFAALGTTEGDFDNLALPQAWGYALIKSVSWRYAGTSQFFLTGDQLFQNALRDQTSRSSCNDLANFGGNYAVGDNFLSPQSASVVLRLPHATASGVNKQLPFPTDCLTSQVQIIVELNNVGDIFTNASGAVLPANAQKLANGYFQIQQIMMNNQGDCLARRVDLSSKAYAFPCEFVQQKVVIAGSQLQFSPNGQNQPVNTVVLSGFRAGQVKSIECWLTNNDDTLINPAARVGTTFAYQPFKWYVPTSVEMVYAGDIYARYLNGTGQLFNLLNGNKAPAFDSNEIVLAGAAIGFPLPYLSEWLSLPFAQPLVDEDCHYILLHGRTITNGIINLQNLILPSVPSVNGWTLNISYVYNATILFSQGSCDYVF